MTLAERRERHYNELARELNAVTVTNLPCAVCGPSDGGYGQIVDELEWDGVPGGMLRLPIVLMSGHPSTEEGYLTGLHELGHVATGFFKRGKTARRWSLRRYEAEAWLWALSKAIVEPSPEAWRWITKSLESYVHPRHKPDPTFDRLLLEATKKGTE